MTRRTLKQYFSKKKPGGAIAAIVFGALIFMFGLSLRNGTLWSVIGAGILLTGIVRIILYTRAHSDQEVDMACCRLTDEFYAAKKAMAAALGVSSDRVITCDGYSFENVFRARLARQGKDGRWRSSIYTMVCVFFTEDTLFCFTKRVSLITDEHEEKQSEIALSAIHTLSLEESNRSMSVVIPVLGQEPIIIRCQSNDTALALYHQLKAVIQNTKGGLS